MFQMGGNSALQAGLFWQRSGSFSIEWSQIEGLVFGAASYIL